MNITYLIINNIQLLILLYKMLPSPLLIISCFSYTNTFNHTTYHLPYNHWRICIIYKSNINHYSVTRTPVAIQICRVKAVSTRAQLPRSQTEACALAHRAYWIGLTTRIMPVIRREAANLFPRVTAAIFVSATVLYTPCSVLSRFVVCPPSLFL